MNNCLGQILLARRMGKTRGIIAETGAGQHGVAVATVCARFGLPCEVYMGRDRRRAPIAQRRAHVHARGQGQSRHVGRRHAQGCHERRPCVIGSRTSPTPSTLSARRLARIPIRRLVRYFQSVIGNETREQMIAAEGRIPDTLVAAIGGGSNAIAVLRPLPRRQGRADLRRRGGGHGLDVENGHAASMTGGRPGVLHGNRTYLLQVPW
ncbi:MAG: pyridoxal-phosphate dependent enzyme [Burkholderiaceae bacterium]